MEEKRFALELTPQELDTVYRALLEIPMKFSLPVVQTIETQVKAQQEVKQPVEEKKEE